MTRRSDDATRKLAGEVGRDLARRMVRKIIEVVDGYPATAEVRAAIARVIVIGLEEYAVTLDVRAARVRAPSASGPLPAAPAGPVGTDQGAVRPDQRGIQRPRRGRV